jgi:hypothetical protein
MTAVESKHRKFATAFLPVDAVGFKSSANVTLIFVIIAEFLALKYS